MKLIIGLGNPGSRYENTRHNAGRIFVEYLAGKEGVSFSAKKALKSSVAKTQWGGETILFLYPEIFMNVSGEAVGPAANYFGIDIGRDLLVVVDEMSLSFGQWRLRAKGSAGGHNGLKSIEAALGSNVYGRLRFGIGRPPAGDSGIADKASLVSAYVLSRFFSQELQELPLCFERGREGCRLWACDGAEKAMNFINPSA